MNNFITKYTESLNVVGIYFVVFPAMAVVNCLYINLYKIKNLMRRYIFTIVGILLVAIVLNLIAVKIYPDYTGVSIATTITYYVWFLLGFRQFKFLKLEIKDIGYLTIYTVGFFFITRKITNEFAGVGLYLVFILILVFVFYRDKLKTLHNYFKR